MGITFVDVIKDIKEITVKSVIICTRKLKGICFRF